LIAVIVLLIDVTFGKAGPIRWIDFGLVGAAAILSLVNVFVHTRDAWTSVVPTGITGLRSRTSSPPGRRRAAGDLQRRAEDPRRQGRRLRRFRTPLAAVD
jgi:hypothetical protein